MFTLTICPNLGRQTTFSSGKPRWLSPQPEAKRGHRAARHELGRLRREDDCTRVIEARQGNVKTCHP